MPILNPALITQLKISGLSPALAARLQMGQVSGMQTPELDSVMAELHDVPTALVDDALQLRRLIAVQTRERAFDYAANAQRYRSDISDRPMIAPDELQARITQFTPDRLSVDWRTFPHTLPDSGEIDPRLTVDVWAHRERINHRHLSDETLRSPQTRVLCSLAPIDDFHYTLTGPEGQQYDYRGYDFYSAETFVNPPEEQLRGASPSYALAFLEASLPPERGVSFIVPDDFKDFKRKFNEVKPQLLLLSGVGKNTRVLLQMALYARQNGTKEIWLGNYAALGPYPIIHQAFDRVFMGLGEDYLHHHLIGGPFPGRKHPPVSHMLADLDWIYPTKSGGLQRRQFQTLHLSARLGCSRLCNYCAEAAFSGGVQASTGVDALRALIDEAQVRGVHHVYFLDPNFGLLWKDQDDTSVEAALVQHIGDRKMTFSVLTEPMVLRKHGEFMIRRGLKKVFLGIESLSPAYEIENGGGTLDALNRKQQDMSETIDLVNRLNGQGVDVNGLYMLGTPGETIEQMKEGIRRLAGIVANSQISTNVPFPGTDLFFEGSMKGWIHNYDPANGLFYGYGSWAPGGVPMDPEELHRTWIWAHQQVNDIRRPGGFLDRNRRGK